MKVLQVLPEFNAGGVELCTLEIARHLAVRGCESIVVSNGGRLEADLAAAGGRHIRLPVHRKRLKSLLQVWPMRRLLREEKPDILQIASRVPGWIAWLAWRKLAPAERPGLVTTVHGFYGVNAYSAIMVRGERVIAVSESVRDYVLANYRRVEPRRLRVVPGGVDLERLPRGYVPPPDWKARFAAEALGLAQGASWPVLLALPGRLTRLKGHRDFFALIAALRARKIDAVGLVVGGAHPRKLAYLDELKAEAGALGLSEAVRFLGHRSDLREIMAVSDLVLSLSQQPESFGRTVVEALALGRPFVGYDHGGVGEQLRTMFPIGCVKLGDPDGLVETVCRVLAERPAPAPVPQTYTLEAMCRSTEAVYRELPGTSGV